MQTDRYGVAITPGGHTVAKLSTPRNPSPPTTQGRWFISCKDIKAALHRAFKVWGKN